VDVKNLEGAAGEASKVSGHSGRRKSRARGGFMRLSPDILRSGLEAGGTGKDNQSLNYWGGQEKKKSPG